MHISREILRTLSFAFALLFCSYVVLTVSFRSRQRKSIFSTEPAFASASGQFAGMAEPSAGGSRLHLQEFHRIAVKDGRPAWEVKASDAEYYSGEGVTHLSDARLVLHREKGSKVRLEAKSAKLVSQNDQLTRAELAGDIVVELDSDLSIETELALYQILTAKISAPERVAIKGSGYSIVGDEFYADLEQQTLKLSRNVVSVFSPEAKVPNKNILVQEEIDE